MLPSKTIPETRKGHALKSKTRAKTTAAAAKKARLNPVEDEDIEDDGPLHNSGNASGQSTARSTLSISPASSFSGSNPKVSNIFGYTWFDSMTRCYRCILECELHDGEKHEEEPHLPIL